MHRRIQGKGNDELNPPLYVMREGRLLLNEILGEQSHRSDAREYFGYGGL